MTSILLLIAFTGLSFAQFDRDFVIQEHQREIRQQKPDNTSSDTVAQEEFNNEKTTIIKQLEVITGDEETRYVIVPGDTLTIKYQDRDTQNEASYLVSGGGEIDLPLAGKVKVTGLNRKQTREKIESILKEYIRHPNVMVAINAEGRYMVMGAVGVPGVYELQPKLTVMEAVLKAGGFVKSDASMGSVMIMRGGPDAPIVTRLNLKKMYAKGDRADNIYVKPGDLIYVPTTVIRHLENFKKNMFTLLVDYYTLGGNMPLRPTQKVTTTTETQ